MNAKSRLRKWSWIQLNQRRGLVTGMLLLLLLTLPAVVQAQSYTNSYGVWGYTATNGAITITEYSGPGGAVTIPDTINGLPVTSIGGYYDYGIGVGAFYWCTNLTNLTIGTNVTSIGEGAFEDTGLTSVTIPDSVTSIGDSAFYGCFALSNISIPNSVTNIGDGAFFDCTSLSAITVDALNPVYSSAAGVLFNKSQTILVTYPGGIAGAYTIPNSVTSIGVMAFDLCSDLTSVTIPNSVTSIGDSAFYYCISLTSITIPNSVTSIGESAFCFCYGLTSVMISTNVSSIEGWTFDYCTSLVSVTIPNSVTSIGDGAFQYCGSLANVTIGTSLTNIGDYSFQGCTSLTGVYFNGNTPSLGSNVFEGNNIVTVYYLPGATGWGRTLGGQPTSLWDPLSQVGFTITNGTITITGYAGPGGAVSIPDTVNGLPVTSIGDYAFYACRGVTSVTIPSSVTSIGASAFDGTCLTSVTIPNSVSSIGAWAFGGTCLASVTIGNSVTSIGAWAFQGCYFLGSVYFKGNAPSVGWNVFELDDNVTVYYLPGATGWGPTFGGIPTVALLPPSILTPPLTQTAEMGTTPWFWVEATNTLPEGTCYQWYFFSNPLDSATNSYLALTNVQPSQAGAYTVVVTNLVGAVTSAPALLSVIPPVERTIVPAVQLPGGIGSVLHLEYAESVAAAVPQWLSLTNATLSAGPQFWFELAQPLPAQRFYRAWQANGPPTPLAMSLATEIPLAGAIGISVRVDYINTIGPTNAWVTLDTVMLTNTSQLYFDTTSWGQPERLYRLVPSP